ncbi:L-aspartate oxidase [Texcoconibacillus texcoconensis]|uniref:Fumarate reductase (CoM/CoB) subunit A n=1 Tax=Texcoconibacillus texcoconensis TaxID=1095777 RepID=A0A840QQU6_9BACI|nr:FAD-binding protein [Texcoconibacillus texcoconensis]MBB5173744.1 fumarate reductase (CoM/CoB) subunit A [Texcoconibacillus texcoconensis]
MKTIKTGILVIGSGAAGLSASVYAAQYTHENILVIDKGAVGKSGSTVGAVQIASLGSWSHQDDHEEAFLQDIEKSGRGLSDPSLTKSIADDIRQRLKEITDWGLKLDKNEEQEVAVYETSGHSFSRSVSARKGKAGLGILQTLIRKANAMNHIDMWSDVITLQLVKSAGRIIGAVVLDQRTNEPYLIQSQAVILATGGIGQLYPITSNPVQSTGDGFSLSLQAGAQLIDMEQIQFYPVSMIAPQSIAGLCISFYHFSKLYNRDGERFMKRYQPDYLENTTRDQLSIAIGKEVAAGRETDHGGVWLDASEVIENVKRQFPHEYDLCKDRGIDLSKQHAEVGPAAHFMMGGVKINSNASSSIPRLFIAGETSGGLHGANRLGNNALSECLVFGARAGIEAARILEEETPVDHQSFADYELGWAKRLLTYIHQPHSSKSIKRRPYVIKEKIQSVLGNYVGVIRTKDGLCKAQQDLKEIQEQLFETRVANPDAYSRDILDFIEASHMLQTSLAIVRSAQMRTESRGAHYHVDYPEQEIDTYHTCIQVENENMKLSKKPVKGV